MIFADIIVDISHEKLDRTFQYIVPKGLESEVRPGLVALIPFGNGNQERKGYIVSLSTEPEYDLNKMKAIRGICNEDDTTEAKLIALAAWMRETYGSTMIQALKTVIPLQDKVKTKEKKFLSLAISREEAVKMAESLQNGRCKARARVLTALLENERLDFTEASKTLGITTATLKPLLDQGIVTMDSDEVFRKPVDGSKISQELRKTLNAMQKEAVCQIREEWQSENPRPVLLFGVTGSGKTEVYMEMIEDVIAQGKSAIVLIPEIALTYQTVRRFYGRFGDKVSVINSRLSQGERYDQFKRAKRGDIQVMVGPRSALFTPFSNLGLVIIDEEHEQTYKSESTPRYHARETAIQRAKMEGANVILGSATPSLEAYSRAEKGEYRLVKLASRFGEQALPEVSIVDLREELKGGNRSIFSRKLQDAMKLRLDRGEQTMLFLNRRGYAGFVSCRSCGQVMKCPHCDVSLSEHNNNRLVCHYCGYERPGVEQCPECGSPYIGGFKAGTQQIEKTIQKMFPKARVLRMDYDTTRKKGSYEEILSSFAEKKADILVGTQMIVKGHDFPDVTLVGVLAADMSLNVDDYRCGERTFQLLTQAVGRSGRSRKAGEAIIQTYHPEHYSIQAAAVQDYESFYKEEISYRMLMDYPPAASMMAILASSENEEILEQGIQYIGKFIKRIYPGQDLHMIGPAPTSIGKINDVYKKVLYLKHDNRQVLTAIKDKTEKYIEINSGFRKIYIQFDFN